ncbi:hypothetical protein DIPPA_03442 [Diplonema papillatum]|nr:hypothetical protein DIPPA_03442 [Diplonema papillatum]
MSVLSDASSPPYPLNSVISRHDLNLRRQQLQQQPERPHHEPGTLAAFLGSSRHPSLSAGFAEHKSAGQHPALMQPPSQLASGYEGSLVGSPRTEAALRHAVDQNRLSERAALQSGQFRPLPAVEPSVYAQRHTRDQFGLLQRQEQELTRVRGFLEQQLAKQNEELARLRVGHEQQLQSVERLHGELMERWQRDPSETKDDEIRRVRIDHAHQVACIKSRQASEMWQLQNHIMHLMQIQQEELERVQALHGQQIRAQNEEQAAELSRIGVVPEGRGISHPIAADPAMQHAFLTQEADNRALQLHAHNEVARMLAEQRTKEGAAVSLLTEREQEIARLQHETVEQMQKVQLESEELKRQQELEMKKLHTIQASKLHDYQSVLRRLGQVEPATDARSKKALEEDEIRRIKERTEEEFAHRLRLQQLYSDSAGRVTEPSPSRLQAPRSNLHPALQERLLNREREMADLVSRHSAARHIESVPRPGPLEENRYTLQLKQQIDELTNALSQKNVALANLEADLQAERRSAAEVLGMAEAMKPEIAHWRQASETTASAQHRLQDQYRITQEFSEREVKGRDETISVLRSETEQLRLFAEKLKDALHAAQREMKACQARERETDTRFELMRARAESAECELGYSTQALDVLSSRNGELEKLHMHKVVGALEDRYFQPDGRNLPQHPAPTIAMIDHPSNPYLEASVQDPAYSPVIDSLAKYIKQAM